MSEPPPTTPYDVVPYHNFPYFETHPDRLRLVAHLFGLEAPPVAEARVLEIGCGAGGNLLPIAELHPGARCLGIDLAATQIEAGRADIATLGLSNIELRHLDLTRLGAADGPFDYVIAHGVYSWVPPAVRARLLEVVAELLSPRGVALVSHNVKPGWYPRAQARELMLWHAGAIEDPAEKVAQARSFLGFLVAAARPEEERHRTILRAELDHIQAMPDWVVLHDYLADVNDGCYFHEFAAELPARGLQYLGDADVGSMLPYGFAPAVREALGHLAPDVIGHEQALDFLKNRAFRQTTMCRAGLPLERSLTPRVLSGLHLSLRAEEGPDGIWRTAAQTSFAPTTDAAREALRWIASTWPGSLPERELRPTPEVADELLGAFAAGVLRASLEPPRSARAGDRPTATAHTRLLASRSAFVTNLRHENTRLGPDARLLLERLDGTRRLEDLRRGTMLAVDDLLFDLSMKALLLA